LRMERELTEKNRLVSSTLKEISDLYDSLDRDLVEARKLQQSLVRERFHDFETAQISLLLRPSGHVGGDLVGFFPINDRQFGVFSIDVSGHGIASALMTARLAAYLTGSTSEQNLAIRSDEIGGYIAASPSEAAMALNRLMLEEMETDLYFTMILGHFDRLSGEFVMTQCGHPYPIVQRANGEISFFGDGGLPVGLIPFAAYEDVHMKLSPGDRILLFSDGVTVEGIIKVRYFFQCGTDQPVLFGQFSLHPQNTLPGTNTRKQFIARDGFGQKIVSPNIQPLCNLSLIGFRSQ